MRTHFFVRFLVILEAIFLLTRCGKKDDVASSLPGEVPEVDGTSSNKGSKNKSDGSASLAAPAVSGETPTQNQMPTWNWVAFDASAKVFRYRLDNSEWQMTKASSFTPSSALSGGLHSLEVQEMNAEGDWSESGSFAILVVTQSVIDLSAFYSVNLTVAPVSFAFYESMPPVGSEILPNSTISLTFTDIINPATISDSNFQVTVDGQVFGTISGEIVNLAPLGSMVSFSPIVPFPLNATVTITLSNDLLDNDGGSISGTKVFTYHTPLEQQQTIELSSISFEADDFDGEEPWSFQGNSGIVETIGGVSPTEGSRMAALSTGSSALISNVEAMEGNVGGPQISSVSLTIKRPAGSTYLLFDYNFLSTEFDEYVNSQYDDILSVSVTGSNGGSLTKTLASVKLVGAADSDDVVFAALHDPNPASPVQQSNFQTPALTAAENVCSGCVVPRIDLSDINGESVTITFTVSDIGDSSYDSAALIDNIRFE